MDSLKATVINVAMKDMLRRGWVDICAIKKCLEISEGIPKREDIQLLEALHCVHFVDMPPELIRGLPVLLQRVLGSEGIDLDYKALTGHQKLLA